MNDIYALAIGRIKGIGPKKYLKIINRFESTRDLWESSRGKLIEMLGPNIGSIIDSSRGQSDIQKLRKIVAKNHSRFVSLGEKDYPSILAEINDPPICLFYTGDLCIPNRSITVVGTRKISEYGERVVRKLVTELVSENFCIISGLAFGTDTLAHKITLENNGKTIAVLGTNINKTYPAANQALCSQIRRNGLVLSEHWFEDIDRPENFAKRNRILAGLSMATLVIEAPAKSGALITASLAFDYNRSVFAVPGDIHRYNSIGCNNLIKNNKAVLVNSAQDIIKELDLNHSGSRLSSVMLNLNGLEKLLYKILLQEPLDIELISRKVDITVPKLLVSLVGLEIKGYIYKDMLNTYYIR